MEIVVAILLLFGGFTLGSISADKSDEDTQSTMYLTNTDGAPDSHPVNQAKHQRKPFHCHADGTHIYRDLTLPYQGEVDQQASQTGDCGRGRDRSCNSAVSYPSAVHGGKNAAIAGRNSAAMEVVYPDD